jgi:ABC-type uncharacterized transport system permease subunit
LVFFGKGREEKNMLIETLLSGAIQSGTSVLYGIYGETVTERAGVINLGIEGCMIMGAMFSYAVTYQTGSVPAGILAGMIAGGLLAMIHAYLVVYRKANQLATGLTLMFLGEGITAFFGRNFVSATVKGCEQIAIPLLSDIPFIGNILFNQDILTYFSYLLCPLLFWFLFKTKAGLKIRGTGEDAEVVYAYGGDPRRIRFWTVVLGGVIAGLGGTQLSIAYTHTWIEGMTNGRGVIAVALVVLIAYNPAKAMIGAYIFGGAQTLQSIVQERGIAISPFLLMMLPYVLTLAALFISSRRKIQAMPAELKKVIESSSN